MALFPKMYRGQICNLVLRLMVQKSPTTNWDEQNPVNNGIKYRPQLVHDFFRRLLDLDFFFQAELYTFIGYVECQSLYVDPLSTVQRRLSLREYCKQVGWHKENSPTCKNTNHGRNLLEKTNKTKQSTWFRKIDKFVVSNKKTRIMLTLKLGPYLHCDVKLSRDLLDAKKNVFYTNKGNTPYSQFVLYTYIYI